MYMYPECELPVKHSLKLNEKIQTHMSYQYKIWNYDKNYMCFDEHNAIKNCRSVIFSHPQNHLLSISPGKTMKSDDFCEKHPNFENIYINEYIDGTMIHLFYDRRIKAWEISSKNNVGCFQKLQRNNNKSPNSLLEMFKDALGENMRASLNSIPLFNYFPKNYCYQFVLLHPENTILYPIKHAMLYLVSVYDITPQTRRAVHIPPIIYESWDFLQNSTILFPKMKKIENWDQISKQQLSIYKNNEHICGYMALHVDSGERAKFMNPQYMQAKELNRENHRLGLYYLCLHKRNLIKEYLQYFPQFRKTFRRFQQYFEDYIEELHAAYLVKYVWKNSIQGEIHEKYRNYVHDIHRDVYIKSGHIHRKKITKQVVYDYMLNKPPGEILYVLCNCRRRSIN